MTHSKKKLSKRRAVSQLKSALSYQAQGENTRAVELLREIVHASEMSNVDVHVLYISTLREAGKREEAKEELKALAAAHPKHLRIQALWAALTIDSGEIAEGLRLFERIKAQLLREPDFLVDYADGLLKANRLQEAASVLSIAVLRAPNTRVRLMAACIKILMAKFSEAEAMLQEVLRQKELGPWEGLVVSARASCRLYGGDAEGAYGLLVEADRKGKLPEGEKGKMAYAAQLAGKPAEADEVVGHFVAKGPSEEERLWLARIANTRHQPALALSYLGSEAPTGEFEVEFLAEKGHALRLSGQTKQAHAVLLQALKADQLQSHLVLAHLHTDIGHICIEEADFQAASAHFEKAQAYWKGYPEAAEGLKLVAQRTAWKHKLEQEAKAQFEETHEEMQALKSRFLLREHELSALRKELEQLRTAQLKAEQRSQQLTLEMQEQMSDTAQAKKAQAQKEEIKTQLHKELMEREKEVEHKTEENIALALKEYAKHCPGPLMKLLRVAERTFQTALHAQLPAAAIAVLYSGVLERLLCVLFVERFEAWLSEEKSRREKLIGKATREKRGARLEYFDNFVAAFDSESRRIPSMGEICRALEKRKESYLETFRSFLDESYGFSELFYVELIAFVSWAKQTLRDPSAHGRGVELAYGELKTFRNRLLFQFKEGQGGLMLQMLAPLAT